MTFLRFSLVCLITFPDSIKLENLLRNELCRLRLRIINAQQRNLISKASLYRSLRPRRANIKRRRVKLKSYTCAFHANVRRFNSIKTPQRNFVIHCQTNNTQDSVLFWLLWLDAFQRAIQKKEKLNDQTRRFFIQGTKCNSFR